MHSVAGATNRDRAADDAGVTGRETDLSVRGGRVPLRRNRPVQGPGTLLIVNQDERKVLMCTGRDHIIGKRSRIVEVQLHIPGWWLGDVRTAQKRPAARALSPDDGRGEEAEQGGDRERADEGCSWHSALGGVSTHGMGNSPKACSSLQPVRQAIVLYRHWGGDHIRGADNASTLVRRRSRSRGLHRTAESRVATTR
jgi:hypothetical protein